MKYTAKFIDEALRNYYDKQSKYMVSNIYAFDPYYGETDLLINKTSNGYTYDIEIKVSRGDFMADFKKVAKHSILESGHYFRVYTRGKNKGLLRSNKPTNAKQRPNRFYFAVPDGMVAPEEVPIYAGLLYIGSKGEITKIKESKLLHKTKLNIEKLLCRKFYFYWLNTRDKLKDVKLKLKACQKSS